MLEKAFGFRRSMLVTDKSGQLVHSEMRFADAYIVVDSEWSDYVSSPTSVGGKNTQIVYLRIPADVDQHCETARRAGAEIIQEPADQFYGERTYRANDPEGHIWIFSQTMRYVTREEAEVLSGYHIEGRHMNDIEP